MRFDNKGKGTDVNLDPFTLIVGIIKLRDGAEVDSALCVAPPRPAKRVLLQFVERLVEAVGVSAVSRLQDGVSGGRLRSEGGGGGHDRLDRKGECGGWWEGKLVGS